MIFVTAGTHEQPFDRLIKAVDDLKADGTLTEEIIVQTGYSTYVPRCCVWKKMFPYPEVERLVRDARIVVTHGGPSSFFMPIQLNKVPVVVPRMQRFGEHVNDHQVIFCRELLSRSQNIILVEDTASLGAVLTQYDTIAAKRSAGVISNNAAFNEGIQKLVEDMFRQTRT